MWFYWTKTRLIYLKSSILWASDHLYIQYIISGKKTLTLQPQLPLAVRRWTKINITQADELKTPLWRSEAVSVKSLVPGESWTLSLWTSRRETEFSVPEKLRQVTPGKSKTRSQTEYSDLVHTDGKWVSANPEGCWCGLSSKLQTICKIINLNPYSASLKKVLSQGTLQ